MLSASKIMACLLLFLYVPMVDAEPFKRVLALTPHVCEMLYAIGASSSIVGAVDYCNYPEAAKKILRVGDYQTIYTEAALRLMPDLAVVLSHNTKGVAMLAAMGVRIVVSNPSGFEGIFADLLMLAKLTGHTEAAQTLVNAQRLRLATIKRQPRSGVRVFYEVWHQPLITAGGTSFIDRLIDDAGGINVFSQLPLEAPRINVEAVIEAKPDMIIIPQAGAYFEARRVFWQQWLGKDHVRFISVNPDLMHRPGPRLIEGLARLQQALNQTQ